MYKYFAFISFSSSDAQEAVRLQHSIESYRLPAVLVRHDRSIPRRVRPLYCYLNDMHATEELMHELKQRMEQSRYLIVLCSPHSAQSVYVNSGINYFISLGRRDNIIPVIVDGIPYSGDESTECFPEALRRHFPKHIDPLRDHSILGINLHEKGVGSHRLAYNRAMLMLVARMLQLDYDGLLLRDKQRRRRHAIGGSVLTAMIVTLLAATWHFVHPISVSVVLSDSSPNNDFLPLCENIEAQLSLPNEEKFDTVQHLSDTLYFHNIPSYYLNKQCRIQIKADNYLPLDTIMTLQRFSQIAIMRDATLYGAIRFSVYGHSQPEKLKLNIAGYEITPTSTGLVELNIPIEQQHTAYTVESQYGTDTIYMPCGENDILILQP